MLTFLLIVSIILMFGAVYDYVKLGSKYLGIVDDKQLLEAVGVLAIPILNVIAVLIALRHNK